MKSATAKQYLELGGKPLIYYPLAAYEAAAEINNIIMVVTKGDEEFVCESIVEKYGFTKVSDIIIGGHERYHSVAKGIHAKGAMNSDFFFVHDGSRPLIDGKVINRAARAVRGHPAIAVGIPATDTIKRVDNKGMVLETLPRESIWHIQTPQVFAASLLHEAYQKLADKEAAGELDIIITDDAMVVETFTDTQVAIIPGSSRNIKVTTTADMELAAMMIGED
jgi:2-C-methyl-D-erythritol 4-phosphate cytidylyltransferase